MSIIRRRNEQNDRANDLRETFANGEVVSNSEQQSPGDKSEPQKQSREEMKRYVKRFLADHEKLYRELAK